MIVDSLKAAAKHMMIDYNEVTAKIQHNGEKGTGREEILGSYLRKYIPDKYVIGRGAILNSSGLQSRQQDCIIYDAFNSPILLNMESTKMIPIESVYAVIEIKSSLNKERLTECVQNIKSVKSLPKKPLSQIASLTAGFVFAYTSDTSLESLLGNLIEFNNQIDCSHQISVICVLDKGLIVNVAKDGLNTVMLMPSNDSTPAIISNPIENNLLLFYLIIMQYLNQTIVSPPNLMKYAEKEIASKVQMSIPKKHIPEGSYFNFEGRKVSVDNAITLVNDSKRLDKISSGKASSDEIISYLNDNLERIIKLSQETLGNTSDNLNWFGKVYDMGFLLEFCRLYSLQESGEAIPQKAIDILKEIKDDLFGHYRKQFEWPDIG